MKPILRTIVRWLICVSISVVAALITKLLGGSEMLAGMIAGIFLVESEVLLLRSKVK